MDLLHRYRYNIYWEGPIIIVLGPSMEIKTGGHYPSYPFLLLHHTARSWKLAVRRRRIYCSWAFFTLPVLIPGASFSDSFWKKEALPGITNHRPRLPSQILDYKEAYGLTIRP